MSSEGGLFQKRELSTEQVDEFAQLMDKGHSAFDEEDFRLALDSYHQASVLDGSGAEVWSCLGLTFTNLAFPREAWRSHKLALAAEPDNVDSLWYAAEFLFNMDDFELANFILERYLQIETDRERLEEARALREECRAHMSEHGKKVPVLASTGNDDDSDPDDADDDEDDDELAGFGYDEGDEDEPRGGADDDFEDEDFAADIDDVEDEGELAFVADMSVNLTGMSGKCSNCRMNIPEDAPYCFNCRAVHFYEA